MEQDDASRTQLGKPSFEIVLNGFVCVVAVYMKNVDCPVWKMLQSFVESAPYEAGKTSIKRIVMRRQICQDIRAVKAGVRITLPRVHSIAQCVESKLVNSLAEGTVRISIMNS